MPVSVEVVFGEEPDPAEPLSAFAASLHDAWGLAADRVVASRRAEEAVAARAMGTAADRETRTVSRSPAPRNGSDSRVWFGVALVAALVLTLPTINAFFKQGVAAETAIFRFVIALVVCVVVVKVARTFVTSMTTVPQPETDGPEPDSGTAGES